MLVSKPLDAPNEYAILHRQQSKKVGLLILFLTEMFERFSYYGMRSILILFAVSASGLGLGEEDALLYYGILSAAIGLFALPMGVLTDVWFKQIRGVQIGGVVLVLGYALLAIANIAFTLIGLCLIVVGVSLVKPNLTVLVGRLFHKQDSRRDLGFIVFYVGVNIGALLASLLVGYVGEIWGWEWGFGFAAGVMLIGLVIFWLGKGYLYQNEKEGPAAVKEVEARLPTPAQYRSQRLLLIMLVFVFVMIYWGFYELSVTYYMNFIYAKDTFNAFGTTFSRGYFQSLSTAFILPLSIIIFLYWYLVGVGKTIPKFALSFILFALGMTMLLPLQQLPAPDDELLVACLTGMFFLHAISEILISPIALSYITRLSPVAWSSTIMGFYFLATYLGNKFFYGMGESMSQEEALQGVLIISLVSFVIGLFLLFARKELTAYSKGIE